MRKITFYIVTAMMLGLPVTGIYGQTKTTTQPTLFQRITSSIKSTIPSITTIQSVAPTSTADKVITSNTINSILSQEILRRCQQPSGCEIVIPTQAHLNTIKNNPNISSVIQDFATAIKNGFVPKVAGLLAAIDLTNPTLAHVIPDVVNRLGQISRVNQISTDPRNGLSNLENPMIGLTKILTISVVDGRPSFTILQRSSEFGDPVKGGISFISLGPSRQELEEYAIQIKLDGAESRLRDELLTQSGLSENELSEFHLREAEKRLDEELSKQLLTEVEKALLEIGTTTPPSREDQSPDAITQSGPSISSESIVKAKLSPVIDPSDTQFLNLSNRFPTGSFVDPEQDSVNPGTLVPVTEEIKQNTTFGKILPAEQGSGLTSGTFVEGNTTLKSDLCDARGDCP